MIVKQLTKKLDGFCLGPIDMAVDNGYVIGIIGRNGSGKSTLLKSILGIHKYEGELQIGVLQSEVAYIMDECPFQKNYSAKHIAMCYGSVYEDFDKKHFFNVCKKYKIPLTKPIGKLSKGMSMMLQYAFAGAYPAKLLLMDEATAHLDEWGKKELYTFIADFVEKGGTVLWASHLYGELDKMADYVLGLKSGKEVFFEQKEQLVERYIKVSGTKQQLDYMNKSLLGRRDGEHGSIGVVDKKVGEINMFGKQETVKIADIVEFVL